MVREVICERCGVTFKTPYKYQRFCSHSCANRGVNYIDARIEEKYDTNLNWTTYRGKWECPYHECVGCYVRNCDKCGWNPEVAKARLEKMGVHHEG